MSKILALGVPDLTQYKSKIIHIHFWLASFLALYLTMMLMFLSACLWPEEFRGIAAAPQIKVQNT